MNAQPPGKRKILLQGGLRAAVPVMLHEHCLIDPRSPDDLSYLVVVRSRTAVSHRRVPQRCEKRIRFIGIGQLRGLVCQTQRTVSAMFCIKQAKPVHVYRQAADRFLALINASQPGAITADPCLR